MFLLFFFHEMKIKEETRNLFKKKDTSWNAIQLKVSVMKKKIAKVQKYYRKYYNGDQSVLWLKC